MSIVNQSTIAEAIARHGNIWTPQTNQEMQKLYEELHAEKTTSYEQMVRVKKALKYGPSERHRIDIYSPILTEGVKERLLPIVVYFHGGAFVMGDIDITPSMHGHIGRYFASNGCICVLATYRLLPEARYPNGAEDVAQVLKWLDGNVSKFGGNTSRVTAIGQSAGGAHLATSIFTGKLKEVDLRIQGTVLLGAPLWYDLTLERRRKNMFAYHSTEVEAEILEKTSVAAFRAASQEELSACNSNILLLLAEFDANEIVDGNLMFVNEYRKKLSRLPLLEVIPGHNHISSCLGIGSEGDILGPRILSFIKSQGTK